MEHFFAVDKPTHRSSGGVKPGRTIGPVPLTFVEPLSYAPNEENSWTIISVNFAVLAPAYDATAVYNLVYAFVVWHWDIKTYEGILYGYYWYVYHDFISPHFSFSATAISLEHPAMRR